MRSMSELGKEALQSCFMRGHFMWRLPAGCDCALTFDDGPHEVYTAKILDLLARHEVKASFFLVGESAVRAPELVRRIVRDGHCVASHTYSHRELPSLTGVQLRHELTAGRRVLSELTGVDTNLVRPPRGRISASALLRMRHWGYRLVHWSKTYSDYLQDGSARLVQRIRTIGLSPGDIALLHDNNAHTLAALVQMLPEWLAEGRTFVKLQ